MMGRTRFFAKGMGIGILAGCVAGIAGICYVRCHKKGIKRNIGKAMRNVGNLMDDITRMM